MNFLFPLTINSLWSFRKELFYLCLTFLMVLLLPVIAVIVMTNSGVEEVSDALVQISVSDNTITLYYPDGTLYKTMTLTTTWPVQGEITNEFGDTLLPFYLFHSGIDIAGKRGDPVTPFMPGKVIYQGEIFWGFGKHIIIDHGDNITSIYGHLDTIKVKDNQEVKPGDVIGTEGSTGWSTGPHLHFQINVFGIPINPRLFLNN
jgi:murein DD-endopeptidase MepM/ murein hydrolase activator NlpD